MEIPKHLLANPEYYRKYFPARILFNFAGAPFDAQRTVTYPDGRVVWHLPKPIANPDALAALVAPAAYDIFIVTAVHVDNRAYGKFVLDVDLNKYKRFCVCDERSCCSVCWILARVVMRHVQRIVMETLRFPDPPLFVYTGGRGLHVWLREQVVASYDDVTREDLFFILKEPVNDADVAWARDMLMPHWGAHAGGGVEWWRSIVQPIYDDCLMRQKQKIRIPFSVHTSGRIALPLSPAMIASNTIPIVKAGEAAGNPVYLEALTYFASRI